MTNSAPPLFRRTEAANRLRISLSTLEKLMRNRQIEYFQFGGSIRFSQEQLDDYLARSRRAATPVYDDLEDVS